MQTRPVFYEGSYREYFKTGINLLVLCYSNSSYTRSPAAILFAKLCHNVFSMVLMRAHFFFTQKLCLILKINWKYKTLIMDNIDSNILMGAAAGTRQLMEWESHCHFSLPCTLLIFLVQVNAVITSICHLLATFISLLHPQLIFCDLILSTACSGFELAVLLSGNYIPMYHWWMIS